MSALFSLSYNPFHTKRDFLMRQTYLFVFVTFLLLVSSGCAAAPAAAPTVAPAQALAATSYPGPQDGSAKTAYPAPAAAAGQNGTLPTVDPATLKPLAAPEPEAGKGSISGIFYELQVSRILPHSSFYLKTADGDQHLLPPVLVGPQAGDVAGNSDEQAGIRLNNVPPGFYYLVVNFPNQMLVAQKSAQDSAPLLLTVTSGSKLDLGVIYLP